MDHFEGALAFAGVLGYVTTDLFLSRHESVWTDRVSVASDFALAAILGYFGWSTATMVCHASLLTQSIQVLGLTSLTVLLAFLLVQSLGLLWNPSFRLTVPSAALLPYKLKWFMGWFSLGGSLLALAVWPTSTTAWLVFAMSCAVHAHGIAQTLEPLAASM